LWSLNRFGHRGAHVECLVWADVVVLPEPRIDDDPRLPCGHEPLCIKNFAAQSAV
jgi:hypothetical protein